MTVPADTAPRTSSLSGTFSTGTDSPVSDDSSASSNAAASTSPSAGTMSPSATRTTSPGTTSAAATERSSPSRTTLAAGALMADSAITACSARTSCTTPTTVFTMITNRITAASERSPVPMVRAAATSRTRISGSRSCCSTRRHTGVRSSAGISLGPWRASRRAASTDDSPVAGVVPGSRSTFAAGLRPPSRRFMSVTEPRPGGSVRGLPSTAPVVYPATDPRDVPPPSQSAPLLKAARGCGRGRRRTRRTLPSAYHPYGGSAGQGSAAKSFRAPASRSPASRTSGRRAACPRRARASA
ncbi:hypothetical protein SPURM210S_04869 [Streptomyces purpurascens]